MTPRIKLLVHAGAPTSHSDDDRYEAQARAYRDLSEVAYSRTALVSPADEATAGRSTQDIHKTGGEGVKSLAQAFLDDTQLAIGALDSQWLNAVVSTRNSARPVVAKSTFSDARPERVQLEAIADLSSDDRSPEEAHVKPSHLYQPATPTTERPCHDQERSAEGNTSEEANSQLPSSYSLTNSESLRSRPGPSQRAISAPEPVPTLSNVRLATAPALVRVHSSPAAARIAKSPAIVPTAGGLNNGVQRTMLRSRSIRPQDPPTSLATYSTHVTPALRRLAQNSTLASCYRPLSVTRQIEPLERGHWLIPCDNLPHDVEEGFWSTVQSVVGNGSAGWGVWRSCRPSMKILLECKSS